jgi:hypothetical protein
MDIFKSAQKVNNNKVNKSHSRIKLLKKFVAYSFFSPMLVLSPAAVKRTGAIFQLGAGKL